MRIWPTLLLTTALAAEGALAQGTWTVSSQAPTCLSTLCGRTAITASVVGEPAPSSVRVYFRAGAAGPEYYIEMTKSAAGYEAVLPAPLRETTSVSYRIVAMGEGGAMSSSDSATVPATADCQLAPLTSSQTAAAVNTVIGLTEATQTGAPRGFSCAGITKVIGVDDTMSPNSACEEVKLAGSDPCYSSEGVPLVANAAGTPTETKAAGGWIGAAALGGAAVAGAVIIDNNGDNGNQPVSQSRP